MPTPSTTDSPQDLPSTPLCRLLGCRYPLMLAGMGGVGRSELVAAVAEAGGFGFLGMVREPLALMREEIEQVRRKTPHAFGVNLIPAATDAAHLAQQIDLCIALHVPVVSLFWDIDPAAIARLREAGITVVHQIGTVADALQAQAAGAHALIAQGMEAGGHVRGRLTLDVLLARVLAVTPIPVAAAGGLATGADVCRVLTQGAQAAVLGTALVATRESFAHDHHKQRLVQARGIDTEVTEAFHINWPPHAPVRVLKNSVTRGERGNPATAQASVIGEEQGRPIYLFSTDSPLRSMTGDLEAMALYAGLGVDAIASVEPAGQRLARIAADAAALLRATRAPAIERASPVCYAAEFEAEDGHAQPQSLPQPLPQAPQQARRPALAAALNELLQAERAGVRVTQRTAAEMPDAARRAIVEAVYRDEVKWCAMLARHILRLQATPSALTGAFHDKAMAIGELDERLAFLNRGQDWVVRKLRELLPQVDDADMASDLRDMLDAHQVNIARVQDELQKRRNAKA